MAKASISTKPKARAPRRPAAINPAAWLDSWEKAAQAIRNAKTKGAS